MAYFIENTNEQSKEGLCYSLESILHDLLGPLTSVVLYAENLEKIYKDEPDKIGLHVRNICSNAKKLDSYICATRHCLNNSEKNCFFEIGEIIEGTLDILNSRIKNGDIEIKAEIDNVQIYNNPLSLYRVLINLISNSIDSFDGLDNKNKSIKIVVKKVDSNIKIKIIDNGCGVPHRMQREIFVLGFSTKGVRGSGYGLSLTKCIIENQYKGEISLRSRIGHGTTINISFPKKFNQKSLFSLK